MIPKTVDELLDRFTNLLHVKNVECLEEITTRFDENDLKSIIYHLTTLEMLEKRGLQ